MGKWFFQKEGALKLKCFYCKGELETGITFHVVTLDNCIIVVKNVPCIRCSQCGETFFDDDVADKLEEIVRNLRAAVTEIAVVNYDKVA